MSTSVGTSRRRNSPTVSTSSSACIEIAERAYVRAAFDECRHIIAAIDPPTVAARGTLALLEARCARDEDDLEAWSSAAERAANDHPSANGRLAGAALRALAHRRAGRLAQADRDWKIVLAKIEREPASALGLPTYYAAFDAWSRGAFDDASTLATLALTDDATRPYATALLGAAAAGQHRSAKAAGHFVEALRLLRGAALSDLGLFADTLERASALACDAVDLKLAKKLQADVTAFSWPSSLRRAHVRTLNNFRFIALLEGDLERAWFLSRDAAVRADDAASAIACETLSAVASRLLGDERAAHLGLGRAWDMIRQQRFAAGDDDARVALATFAREAASDLPSEARKAMTSFETLTSRELRASDAAVERRVRAFGEMAHGRIAEVRGHYDAAYDRYRASFDLWLQLGDRMRAAILALDLQRLARDPLFDETLDAVLERAPDAWFAPQASPASELLARLTPAETLVLGALLGGKSARAIASDLDRSVHTINNHTRKIFAAFEVTSRAAVLAHCAELGITVKSLERIV